MTPRPTPLHLTVGEVARRTGLTVRTLHHYDALGLVSPSARSEAGYRQYSARDLDTLHFIKHAREVDFSLAQIQTLLELKHNPHRASADVKQLVGEHISALQHKINRLQSMADTLQGWYDCCKGNQEPDCAIIEQLSENKGTP